MKIDGLSQVLPMRPALRSVRQAPSGATQQHSSVQISDTGAWLQEMQSQGGEIQAPRADVVAEIKASLADGSFESSVDMEQVLDGLLAEL